MTGSVIRTKRVRTRRSLVFVLLSAVALVAAACGGSSSSSSTTGATTSGSGSAAPANTDSTLRVSTTYPPLSLDPTTVAAGVNPYQSLVYDRLLNTDAQLNLVPMLATAWKFSSDGMTLSLTLRSDVKFHTGNAMNGAAVVASLTHWKTAKASLLSPALSEVTSVESPTPTTVEIHLSKPDATILATLASTAGTVIDPTAFTSGANLTNSSANYGSGPWVVKSYVITQKAVFVRAPDPNWDTKAGQIKEIDLDFTTDQNARLNAMQTHTADMAYINNGETFQTATMTAGGGFTLYKLPSGLQITLVMNQSRAPFTDPKVRQAIAEAIDPSPIVNGLFKGDCTDTQGSIYLPDTWAYAKADNKYGFNLDAAKSLLAQTSVPKGFTFTAITNAGGADASVATVLQSDLAKIGITMKINALSQVAEAPLTQARNYDAEVATVATAVDPGAMLAQNFLTPGGLDIAGSDSAALAAIAGQAVSPSLSQSQRATFYKQANQLIADSAWTVPLCNATTPWLTTSKVQNVSTMNWLPNFDLRYLSIKS